MGEHQSLGFGLEGRGGGLPCRAVELFGSHGGEGIVESTFHAEEVGALNIRDNLFGVGGVGTVSVATGGIDSTGGRRPLVGPAGNLIHHIAVGGHRVHQREGRDAAAIVFEEKVATLAEIQLVVTDLIVDMAARGGQEGLHGRPYTHRGIDVEWLFPSAEMHGADQPGKPEEMVAMQVGEEDMRDGLETLVVDAYLRLGGLATVEEETEAVDVDHLPATMAGTGGEGRTGAEDCDEEVQGN